MLNLVLLIIAVLIWAYVIYSTYIEWRNKKEAERIVSSHIEDLKFDMKPIELSVDWDKVEESISKAVEKAWEPFWSDLNKEKERQYLLKETYEIDKTLNKIDKLSNELDEKIKSLE